MFKIKFRNHNQYKDLKPVTKKPILPAILLLIVIVVGTIGYYILWFGTDSTLVDALFMTFITIATIGYKEVHPLGDIGKIFTILVSIGGIGSMFYVLSILMENLFIVELSNYRGKKREMKKIEKLENHIILVGYGRVGQLSANRLLAQNQQFVVIDDDFNEEDTLQLKKKILTITGDATKDKILMKAGLNRAKGIIVSTGNSATNLFVVLSAKVLNPNIFIVARADEDSSINKLMRAGADRVVNPYAIGGQRLANLMINTQIVDFLETSFGIDDSKLKIENLKLPANCTWFNVTLKDLDLRKRFGVSILAVIRDGKPNTNPGGNFLVKRDDQFIMMGTHEELTNMESHVVKKI